MEISAIRNSKEFNLFCSERYGVFESQISITFYNLRPNRMKKELKIPSEKRFL